MNTLHKTLLLAALLATPFAAAQAQSSRAAHEAWLKAQQIDIKPTLKITETTIPAGSSANAPNANPGSANPGSAMPADQMPSTPMPAGNASTPAPAMPSNGSAAPAGSSSSYGSQYGGGQPAK
jgi:hypothetical protein